MRTLMSAGIALVIVSAYVFVPFFTVSNLLLWTSLSIEDAIGYSYEPRVIDQYEFQRRFNVSDLPQVSGESYQRFVKDEVLPGYIVRTESSPHVCIEGIWDGSINICILNSGGRNYLYQPPLLVNFPCKDPLEWLLFFCSRFDVAEDINLRDRDAQTIIGTIRLSTGWNAWSLIQTHSRRLQNRLRARSLPGRPGLQS